MGMAPDGVVVLTETLADARSVSEPGDICGTINILQERAGFVRFHHSILV